MKILKGGPFGKITQCLSVVYKYSFIFFFMAIYAIVQASGKQVWVEENRFYDLNKLPLAPGDKFKLNKLNFELIKSQAFGLLVYLS